MTYKWEFCKNQSASWTIIQIETGKTLLVKQNRFGEYVFSLTYGGSVINYTCEDKTEIESMLDNNL